MENNENNRELFKKLLQIPPASRTTQQVQEIGQKLSSFFTKLNLSENQIQQLGRYVTVREYFPKDVVFEEGDVGDAYYMIHSGSVEVVRREKNDYVTKKPTRIAILEQGNGFGEVALLYGTRRIASIIALENS